MIDRKALQPGVWIEVRGGGWEPGSVLQVVKAGRVNVRASCDVRFSPTGPWHHQEHTIALVHVVRVVPQEEIAPRGEVP